METVRNKRRKRLRRAGLIVGLSAAVWWLLFGIVSGNDMGLDFIGSLLHTALPGLIFLVNIAIAWKWESIGGMLLIVEALVTLAILSIITNHCPQMNAALILLTMSLPLLLSGILFVISRKEGKKQNKGRIE
jgi:hypothetical protein